MTFITGVFGTILSILLFALILGILVFVHEFGHFITAKKSGVHIHEFSIGMGPLIKTIEGKDGINYSIRAFPIGGFVQMAGEVYEDDETKTIPKEKFMCNRPWYQRLIILCAGVFNNFLLAIILFFFLTLANDVVRITPIIDTVEENSPAEIAGLKSGDRIMAINGEKTISWDKASLLLILDEDETEYTFTVKHNDGKKEDIKVTAEIKEDKETKTKQKRIGVTKGVLDKSNNAIWTSLKYSVEKVYTTIDYMFYTVINLFTGKVPLNSLSGPVGIYEVVDETRKEENALANIVNLTAILSVNLGLMNILPIPALDGGHVLFLLIELITRKKVNEKLEGITTTIFFFLLMLLMLYITIKDVIVMILR